jgi:mRNA interferase MazF
MARVLRGDVIWANLNPVVGHEQAGHRPVVVLSADVFNRRSGTVIAMAVTSQPQRAGYPLTLELESVSMGRPAWVKISQVRTLSVHRLGRKLGRVSPQELERLVDGLNEIIS